MGLASLSLLAFWLNINQLGLYADDWSFLQWSYASGWGLNYSYLSARPLHALPWVITFPIFGFNLIPRYIFHFAILLANSFLLFRILDRILPSKRAFNFITSALFLTYPTMSTFSWLSTGPLHIAVLLFFLSLLIFELNLSNQVRPARIKLLLSSLTGLLFFASLLFYELHLGLVFFVPLFGCLMMGSNETVRKKIQSALLWSAPYILGAALYLGYRILFRFFIVLPGRVPEQTLEWNLQTLLEKILVMRGNVGSIWGHVVDSMFESNVSNNIHFSVFILAALLCAFFAYCIWSALKLVPATVGEQQPGSGGQEARKSSRFYLQLTVAGLMMMVFGYLTILPSVYWPAWPNDFSSRVGYAAAIGASLAVAGAVNFVVASISSFFRLRNTGLLFILPASLLVGLSVANSYLVQLQYVESWKIQRHFYSAVHNAVPDLADGTLAILVNVPDRYETVEAVTFSHNAMRLLYNNPTIDATSLNTNDFEASELVIVENGIIPHPWLDQPHPFNSILILVYSEDGKVRIAGSISEISDLPLTHPEIVKVRSNKALILKKTQPEEARQCLIELKKDKCSV